MMNDQKQIIDTALGHAISYETYRNLVETLFKEGKLTSGEATPEMLNYTKVNMARMNRVEKTAVLSNEIVAAISKHPKSYLLVISEGWCGDAAQLLPLLKKINDQMGQKEMAIVLRDSYLPLIDQFLTNGKSRSIPIAICLDADTNEVLWHWGPRPTPAQQLLDDAKAKGIEMEEQKEMLHKWYADDKTVASQKELVAKMRAVL